MDKIKQAFAQNSKMQALILVLLVLVSALSVYTMAKSVIAFLFLLASLLLLHYTSFTTKIKWIIGGVLVILIIPFASSGGPAYESYMEVATQSGIYIAMALGLNIVVGFAGLLDLGFVAFFAIGAYTYGIFSTAQANKFLSGDFFPLSGSTFWLFIFIGGFIAALFGVLLGLPVLRVKGDYLAIVTLGFGEIVRIIFNNLEKPINITNGAKGISSIKPPDLFGLEFTHPHEFYFIVIGILAFVIFGVKRFEHSRIGRSWKAVRENEIAAQSMGVPLIRTKLTAFAVGASFSGMMGVVFAAKQTFIDPSSFTLLESITILVMVVLGGMGSVPGVILGAGLITILNLQVLTEFANWLNQLTLQGVVHIPFALSPAKMQRFIFGAILILFAVFRPNGLISVKNRKVNERLIQERVSSTSTPSTSVNPIAPQSGGIVQ
ncbi:branched-chain amino acid ABC transporter permease [Paenibacillus chondroitinus]|uniref:Branched-chain amino acid ABC transporter permease n=1 Tax=Paenibacillus chondroitinus TaxID=59842 RepID=A0ABU6D829_9BACL|nr:MULTISPECIES: branched-chain amino acid ABC transporter permease [Paenibacillus]MCY9661818.1 branched-chain amino acid ABC transporter permease [Paenibacillus anseongense]MEB4793904.1 branched-chain amino acid ABC transporter permease [Paenibacillus chondroitinus]